MKKIYFLLLAFSLFTTANAQIVNIPDANFKLTLLSSGSSINGVSNGIAVAKDLSGEYIKIDANSDGEIQVTEALNVSDLNLDNRFTSTKIADLTGIQSFVNLKRLSFSDGNLNSVDLSSLVNLTYLVIVRSNLSSLNVSSLVNLQWLNCSFNQLSSLDVSSLVNLIWLECVSNKITSIDVSSLFKLKELQCGGNNLSTLDVAKLVNLNLLSCSSNNISSLDVSKLVNLTSLSCGRNNLSTLDVSPLVKLTSLQYSGTNLTPIGLSSLVNLIGLDCSNNSLSSLDISSLVNLKNLNYSNNSLSSLDVSSFVKLETLNCSNNNLESLNISSLVNLKYLYCSDNNLNSLDVNNKTKLAYLACGNNKLKSLFIKNGYIYLIVDFSNNLDLSYICCIESQLASIQKKVNDYGYANCQVNSYCSFVPGGTFYTIQGNQRLDSNNNGCDVNDVLMPNLKYAINSGTTTGSIISDISGNYSIPVQTGTHTIKPVIENPSYFSVSPTTVNITFPTQTSPFTQNFCITPNGVRPDLEVTLLPLQPARPGFDAKYKLVYKNKGNTMQSGAVKLTFNDAVLDFVIANTLTSTQSTNTLSWNFTTLQPFENREITFTMNVNSPMETPAVNNGDILNFTTTITSSATDETPLDNTFTLNQTVVGSYDPNDKTCLEGAVITPALIGQYVHYMIRFENTGTFAATNVVVKDMIDLSKFDISTLVPTSASHSFVTKISDGNKVEFIFENINLPFDDANNDGYIAFKIKTKPTLVVNDSFTNEANIYFDYNFPILTNKATSTFKTLGTQDFDFDRFFTLYPNPAKSDLNITAKETINVNSISIYNTLGQLVLVVTNADKVSKIDVSSLTAGNYFIQIKTDKGSSNAWFVKE